MRSCEAARRRALDKPRGRRARRPAAAAPKTSPHSERYGALDAAAYGGRPRRLPGAPSGRGSGAQRELNAPSPRAGVGARRRAARARAARLPAPGRSGACGPGRCVCWALRLLTVLRLRHALLGAQAHGRSVLQTPSSTDSANCAVLQQQWATVRARLLCRGGARGCGGEALGSAPPGVTAARLQPRAAPPGRARRLATAGARGAAALRAAGTPHAAGALAARACDCAQRAR